MNTFKNMINDSVGAVKKIQPNDIIESPIFAIIIGICISFYLIHIRHSLPHSINLMLQNQVSKIFIIAIFAGIQRFNKYAPIILALIIICVTCGIAKINDNKYIPMPNTYKPSVNIISDIQKELNEKDIGLHPFNKTIQGYDKEKIFDPNAQNKESNYYNMDSAIYDLNPIPIAITADDGTTKLTSSNIPDKDMQRYSAHNGYTQ